MPCPGAHSPQGWLPRLAAKLAAGTLGPWLTPRFGRPAVAVAPLFLGGRGTTPPPSRAGRRRERPGFLVSTGDSWEGIIKRRSSLTNTLKKYRGGLRPECNKINNLLNHKVSFCAHFDGLLSRNLSFCTTFYDIYDRQERRMRRPDTIMAQ